MVLISSYGTFARVMGFRLQIHAMMALRALHLRADCWRLETFQTGGLWSRDRRMWKRGTLYHRFTRSQNLLESSSLDIFYENLFRDPRIDPGFLLLTGGSAAMSVDGCYIGGLVEGKPI